MDIPLTEAEGRLADLVRHAEAGEDVVLTHGGRAVARVTAVALDGAGETRSDFDAALDAIVASARRNATPGPCAARSADFLYDEDGLPA